MKINLNTSCNLSEINSRIAGSIDYSNEHTDVSETDNKLFYGTNTPDGYLISKKDGSKGSIYRFKVVVRNGKDGKPELFLHFYPGIIHLCTLVLLAIVFIGKDHRIELLNNLWIKALLGILLIAIVLVPNVLEYKSVKDDLLGLFSKP